MRTVYLLLLICAIAPVLHASTAWLDATLVEDLSLAASAENEVMVGLNMKSSMNEENMPSGELFDADSTFHMENPMPVPISGSYYPMMPMGPSPIPSYDQRAPWHLAYWTPPSMSVATARMYGGVNSDLMTQEAGEDMVTAPSLLEWRGARKNNAFHVRRLRGGAASAAHPRPAYGYNNPAYTFGSNGYAGQVTDVHPYSTHKYHPGYVAGFSTDRRHAGTPLPPQVPFLPPPPYTTPLPLAGAEGGEAAAEGGEEAASF